VIGMCIVQLVAVYLLCIGKGKRHFRAVTLAKFNISTQNIL